MAAVSSLSFNVYEQYTAGTDAAGATSQSGSLQAGVTVGTDDGSTHGAAIILDVKKAPATKKIADDEKAVDKLTQAAIYGRTQAPKDAAASRLAQAIEELRAINLVGGGLRAVQEAVRVAQDIASAVRDLATAEEAIAAEGGGASGGSDGASAGAAAAAAISAALSGASSTPSVSSAPAATATPAVTGAATPAQLEAGYGGQVGSDITGLVAGQAGLGTGAQANQKVSSSLAQDVIAELQATGLPVDATSLTGSLQQLIANPVLGAQALQTSAQQAGLTVTVATSLDVQNTLTDPRDAAAAGISPEAAAAAIDDPYDELVGDAVAALAAIGKGLKRALPPLLNSPNKKVAREARKAQDQFGKAVADTVQAIADYYGAKSEVAAEGGGGGTPSPQTKAAIDAADAVVHGSDAGNDAGDNVAGSAGAGNTDTQADDSAGTAGDVAAVGDDGTPSIAAGSVASTSIAIHVSVNIHV